MFTYLNPAVRDRLVAAGQLLQIDLYGQVLADPAPADAMVINVLGPIPLPLQLAGQQYAVKWYAAVRHTELAAVEQLSQTLRAAGQPQQFAQLASAMAVNSVLVVGEPAENPLVRVHSSCLTGDVFGSARCDCGPQLTAAVQRLAAEPNGGAIIYMAGHEGRGIGLWAKAATYLLQDSGENTYQANESLGLPADSREYDDAASLLLFFFGDCTMRILTNNPQKLAQLQRAGLNHLHMEKHIVGVTEWNRAYLTAKQQRGHGIASSDLADS